ncbi:hypothetical protein D3C85_1846230 [compost metagenome]
MGNGCNVELWIASGLSAEELNAAQLFDLITKRANDVMSALYQDLELPDQTTAA